MIYHYLFEPFFVYDFMFSALMVCIALSFSSVPLGVFMVLRRMGLMGEALSHGILPGIAVSFLISGLSIVSMTIGGMLAGIFVALLSHVIVKKSNLPEDSSLSALYIIFLSIGFLLISLTNSGIHLTHILFGNILSINHETVLMIISVSIITGVLLLFYARSFLWIGFDPIFCRVQKLPVDVMNILFMVLVVINIVASCQALGTLMALGMMLLPAITVRLLTQKFSRLVMGSMLLGVMGSYAGIILSYHFNLASGPLIIFCFGLCFLIVFLFNFIYKSCVCRRVYSE